MGKMCPECSQAAQPTAPHGLLFLRSVSLACPTHGSSKCRCGSCSGGPLGMAGTLSTRHTAPKGIEKACRLPGPQFFRATGVHLSCPTMCLGLSTQKHKAATTKAYCNNRRVLPLLFGQFGQGFTGRCFLIASRLCVNAGGG